MTIQLKLTKRELDFLLRGIRGVLTEEVDRGTRMNGAYKQTKNFEAAEAIEGKLIAAFNASCTEAK